MVLRMVRPTVRANSSLFQFKCRVPVDLVERARGKFVMLELPGVKDEPPVLVSVTAGVFIKFSLKTRDPDVAKFRASVANTQVTKHFNAWRQGP